ncbi:MAG: hypothetical protein H6607_06330 [Flavobacteriales bacterium]|nr:hypothetical protein [Flavobacteriales bacterium]
MSQQLFYRAITELRRDGSLVLYQNIFFIAGAEETEVALFLENEYQLETNGYLLDVPPFDAKAALWAARLIYHAAQFILYRANSIASIDEFIVDYEAEPNASSVLSADLCLRFMPMLVESLRKIEPSDPLIDKLYQIMRKWHFSGIAITKLFDNQEIDFNLYVKNAHLSREYINRIVTFRNVNLARHPAWHTAAKDAMGLYQETFWPNLINV